MRLLLPCFVGILFGSTCFVCAQDDEGGPKSVLAKRIDAYFESPNSIVKRAERARSLGEEFEEVVAELDLTRAEKIVQELQKIQFNEIRLYDEVNEMQERVRQLQEEFAKKKLADYQAKLAEWLKAPDADVSAMRDLKGDWTAMQLRARRFNGPFQRGTSQQEMAVLDAWIKVHEAIQGRDRIGAHNALRTLAAVNRGIVPKESVEAAMVAIREIPNLFDEAIQRLGSLEDLAQVRAHVDSLRGVERQDTQGVGKQIRALDDIRQALQLKQMPRVISDLSKSHDDNVHPKVDAVFEELRLAAFESALADYGVAVEENEGSLAYARRTLRDLVARGDLEVVSEAINKLIPGDRVYRSDVKWLQSERDQIRGLVAARRSSQASDFARAASHYRLVIEARSPSQIGLGDIAAERLKSLLTDRPDLADARTSGSNVAIFKQIESLRNEIKTMQEVMMLQRPRPGSPK